MKKITLIVLSSLFALSVFAQPVYTPPQAKENPKKAAVAKAVSPAKASGLDNLRDPKLAMEVAKKEGKIVMYHFTGSSWCPPCKQLEAKVMSDKKFIDFAKKNLAYVNMDNNRSGFVDKQFDAEYKQLMAKYGVRGFPSLILINPKNGKTESMVGYSGASAGEIINKIEAFKRAR